jgi:hypothetical protein
MVSGHRGRGHKHGCRHDVLACMHAGIGVQHTCEPHTIAVLANAICDCGLCDADGRLHYDADISSARDDHYYTFMVRPWCRHSSALESDAETYRSWRTVDSTTST